VAALKEQLKVEKLQLAVDNRWVNSSLRRPQGVLSTASAALGATTR
jgi:hypothetical protein